MGFSLKSKYAYYYLRRGLKGVNLNFNTYIKGTGELFPIPNFTGPEDIGSIVTGRV